MKLTKPALALTLSVAVLAGSIGTSAAANSPHSKVKNVIVLMTDGTNATGTTAARWYQGGQPLAIDEIVVGALRTYSAESLITDSAPAATAFATGHITNTKMVGVLPDKTTIPGATPVAEADKQRPVASVLEGARALGKSTGIIATSNIQHASPAGYSAHIANRNDYNAIAEQQLYQNIDVIFGGGLQYMLPTGVGNGKRTDGENLVEKAKEMGYQFVTNTAELKAATGSKLIGTFADDAMAYDMDRDPAKEPALAEMTQKAIDTLSKDKDGFFLFVEASKPDWAAHANDPMGIISDVLAWDKAVKAAVDFAKKDGQTLVIAFSDHGNGGMTIGNTATNSNYDTLSYSTVFAPLQKAKLTGEGIATKLNADRSNVKEVMAEYFGITDLTEDEIAAIKAAKASSMNYTVGPMISKRANIGWTTGGHTGEDLFFYAYGPGKPTGTIHHTDIAKASAAAMGFDLDQMTNRLFGRADSVFNNWWTTRVDTTDKENPVFVAELGPIKAEFPINTSIVKVNGVEKQLSGLTISTKAGVFLPSDAISSIFAR